MKGPRALTFAIVVISCAVGAAGGCGSKHDDTTARAPMTQAQRDSAIAASRLPGAAVVGKALAASDSARARAARENAAGE